MVIDYMSKLNDSLYNGIGIKNTVYVSILFFCFFCLSGCVTETTSGTFPDQNIIEEKAVANNQREKIAEEKEIMELITILRNDPEMQAVLNDPAAMNAVIFMDMNFIENDPRMKKLRNNPRMREILKKLGK